MPVYNRNYLAIKYLATVEQMATAQPVVLRDYQVLEIALHAYWNNHYHSSHNNGGNRGAPVCH